MRLRWSRLYREAELYKAAVKVYTKPLFQWRKALSSAGDGSTLYDFARDGLKRLDRLHSQLASAQFHFGAGLARRYTFNGKRRTIYLYPWAERVVDTLLFRLLGRRLDGLWSASSYAYRYAGFGVDLCQTRLSAAIRRIAPAPLFVFTRDIADYFASIDHETLLRALAERVQQGDYLWHLLAERVRFRFELDGAVVRAERGVPFGTPVACLFANLYLDGLDRALAAIPRLAYFRYADDLLGVSGDSDTIARAARVCEQQLAELRLSAKASHSAEYALGVPSEAPAGFAAARSFRYLGLEFRADGRTALSRDKARKLRNIFRYAFRRKAGMLRRLRTPQQRAALAAQIARRTLLEGVKRVAIVDYYLKHVRDEAQLQRLDRWLAEEVLAIAFQDGHKRGRFRWISFRALRAMGLPSLRHRARLIRHGQIRTSFFQWHASQQAKRIRGRGRAAPGVETDMAPAFSPGLAAAAG